MIHLKVEDIIHKSYLNRLLIEIIDQPVLAANLYFKGGTCATMLGYLDRFSVDLDFDMRPTADTMVLRQEFRAIINKLGLTIAKEFDSVLMFQVKYPNDPGKRNLVKVSVNSKIVTANQYKAQYLPDIDRLMNCQTIETMFANKLVAVLDRYTLHGTLAGRDIYDIHHFFVKGYVYSSSVITERTGLSPQEYFKQLTDFITQKVSQRTIDEDLNTLLPADQFQQIRKILIPETLAFLSG